MLGSIIRHRIAWHRAGGARRAPLTRGAALLACLLLSLPAAAQDEADSGIVAEDASDPWRLEFSPWIWLMGIDGEIGASGAPVDVSQSFADVMETSDSVFALSGRLELGHGRLGFFADGFYADLGVDDVGPASTDVEFQQVLLDFGVMYRVVDHEPAGRAGANRNDLTLDLYVGGRYSSLDLDLRPEGAPSTHDGRDWLDPIVGAKLVLPVAERLHLMLCGDVGGLLVW